MKINIQKGNLFELSDYYSLAHCISQDTDNPKSWNLGIVKEFKKRFTGIKEYTDRVIKENNLKFPCVVSYVDDKNELKKLNKEVVKDRCQKEQKD